MLVSALASALVLFADTVPAAAPAPEAPPPAMKRVCVKKAAENTRIPKVSCMMVPVKTETAPEKADDEET